MALTIDTPRAFHGHVDAYSLPMADDTKLYVGESVASATGGYHGSYDASTYTVWTGFALEQVDNQDSAARGGTSTDGGREVLVAYEGVVEINVVGSSVATVGDAVYAVNDGSTFTTSSGTDQIGNIIKWISGTKCLVRFRGQINP